MAHCMIYSSRGMASAAQHVTCGSYPTLHGARVLTIQHEDRKIYLLHDCN
jgi:hypothetical protein